MIAPLLITGTILGGLYYLRSPVSQLRQGKRYRIVVNYNTRLPGVNSQPPPDFVSAVQGEMTDAGFSNVTFVRGPVAKDGVLQYTYDGTWTQASPYFGGVKPEIGVSFYEKLF